VHAPLHYRDQAVDCLLAARDCPPYSRKLYLSLAALRFSLVRYDEVMNGLLASMDSFDGRRSHSTTSLFG
jgi:hypothetical protein